MCECLKWSFKKAYVFVVFLTKKIRYSLELKFLVVVMEIIYLER